MHTYKYTCIHTYLHTHKASCQFRLCKKDYVLSYLAKDGKPNNNNNNNNNKQTTCISIDVAIPEDKNVIKKEAETFLKY